MIKVHWLMYLTDPVWQGLFYNHIHDWFIHSLSHWVILFSQSSRNHKSQTVRARDLPFWEFVHPPPCVTCHMSHVKCHVSGVRCQVSPVMCQMSHVFILFFPGQIGGACWWMVCYQRVLPRLVYKQQWFLMQLLR